jgi:uncharacterized protein (UPF0548 family)
LAKAFMFCVRRPSQLAVDRFAARSQELSLSYAPIGLAQGEPAGYDIGEIAVAIGRGRPDFERAKAAVAAWKPFDIGWVETTPRSPSLSPGTVITLLVHHVGIWSLNGCRIVYGIGDRERGLTFGFAYGTLANHAESGEEMFAVSLDPESEDVTYRIRAVSRPRALLARIGSPLARSLQARFRRESADALQRAVRA